MAIVRAAGGLLWRHDADGRRLAVIHRPRHDDWSLPKGKLDDGESWEEAAVREVQEETGCRGRITAFAGATFYVPRRAPKIVLYWHMVLEREGRLDAGDEVDQVAWLAPAEALARLDHEPERRLVERAPGPRPPGAAAPPAGAAAAELASVRADLLRRILNLDGDGDGSGLGPALDLLDRAEDAVARGDGEGARQLTAAARRLALLGLREPELSLAALALREAASELAPGPRRAIRRLLPRGEAAVPEAVYLAATIRDGELERARPSNRPAWVLAGAALLALALAAGLMHRAAGWPDLAWAAACGALGGAAASALIGARRGGPQ
jgi:8-oxo-dGTP diphosphatase